MKYKALIKLGEKEAKKANLEETAVKSLLLDATNKTPTELYLELDNEAEPIEEEKYLSYLNEYTVKKRPIQYILGYAYFYGYKILVNEGTLIPRWETEELANNILIYYDRLFKDEKVKVLDLGTGSGAIAIALAKEEANMNVFASDLSKDAIMEAEKSAKLNDAKVEFRIGSWFEPFDNEKFDIIVSNPPYLTTTEYVEDIVKNNEPDMALYGGEDGLKYYRDILKDARKYLNEKFVIGFEHGYDTKEELNKIIKLYFEDCEIVNLKDSMDRDRMTFIIKE